MRVTTRRNAESVKAACACSNRFFLVSAFKPCGSLKVKIANLFLVKCINTNLICCRWRDKGFFANGGKIALAQLYAISSLPAIIFTLHSFGADFISFIRKDSANLVALKFDMLVISNASKQVDLLKKTIEQKPAIDVDALLLKANCYTFFFFFALMIMIFFLSFMVFIMVVIVAMVMSPRDAVIRPEIVKRDANEAAFSNIREACRIRLCLNRGVFDYAECFLFIAMGLVVIIIIIIMIVIMAFFLSLLGGAEGGAFSKAWNVEIFGRSFCAV